MFKDDITQKLAQAYLNMHEKKVTEQEIEVCEKCGKVHEGSCSSTDKKETKEALKGNQKKLDMDKDGDIEADDLAALRAKAKAVKESQEQGVAEEYDKLGYHTSLTNGKFMPSKYGNKEYVYLHDLDNKGSDGSPQLVTVNKPTVAKRIAKQFGGDVLKTTMNTYRIVQPAKAKNKK